jgi:hypothetical protein
MSEPVASPGPEIPTWELTPELLESRAHRIPKSQVSAGPALSVLLLVTVALGVAAMAIPRTAAPVEPMAAATEATVVRAQTSQPARASAPKRHPKLAVFEPRGDLTDRFCRPLKNETDEEWLARVPSYCLD